MKFLSRDNGENVSDLGLDNILDVIPKAKCMKEKKPETDKLNFIKIKQFCAVKITVKGMKRQATAWEKNICETCI